MPAYLSHAIMGEEVYKKSIEESLFKIEINQNDIKTYSLGVDLAAFSKANLYLSHNTKTREFFLNMILYIKENNLLENSEVIALLYGHIAHYFLDINTHPLIYYNEVGQANVTKIDNHKLVEGYLSSYLSEQILGKDYMEIKPSYFNKGNLKSKEVINLLKVLYYKTYNEANVMSSYKKVLALFTGIETIIKSGIVNKEQLVELSGFKKFLITNNIHKIDFLNKYSRLWRNPVTGELHYESFMDLYKKAIQETIEAIDVVNKCLYDGISKNTLDRIFTGLSYDTGVDISLGKTMKYVRRQILF